MGMRTWASLQLACLIDFSAQKLTQFNYFKPPESRRSFEPPTRGDTLSPEKPSQNAASALLPIITKFIWINMPISDKRVDIIRLMERLWHQIS